jgi:phosphoglycerate dehydrogenase-like enzyme
MMAPMAPSKTVRVLIASYLEPELVERVRAVDSRILVTCEPALLRPPRYPADHTGGPLTRTPAEEALWRRYLAEADVLFDFDQTHLEDLPELAPRVKWIQATSAGIGQLVSRMEYDRRMPRTVFTTASGVHAQPLAEFCVLAMLTFAKGLLGVLRAQERRHWERYAGTDLAGRTIGIVGVGRIGREVARIARAFHMRVLGVKRDASGDARALHVDELHGLDGLFQVLARSEFLVLVAPHTGETERLIGGPELARLPRGAIVINIGRGALVDEPALVESLRSGHLGGAALDVFAEEPLPAHSPLWEMPNVLVSPHSGSTSDRENGRITDLFCRNLRRFLANEPLLNVLDTRRQY